MKKRIIICGSRTWTNNGTIYKVLSRIPNRDEYIIVTGGARGADQLANTLAENMGFQTEVYPAKWDEEGKAAGFYRNERMIALDNVTHVFGFRSPGKSNGTDHMMQLGQGSEAYTRCFGAPNQPYRTTHGGRSPYVGRA